MYTPSALIVVIVMDDPAAESPEPNANALPLSNAYDDTLSATGPSNSVSSAREELPAIAAPQVMQSATVHPINVQKGEKTGECKHSPLVDESEVYFLIADFLKRRSVCPKAADTLIQELTEHELLGSGVDWTGKSRIATYEDFRLRHRDISSSHLVQLLHGAAASFPGLSGKKEVNDVGKNAPDNESRTLLLRSRLKVPQLTLEERLELAKQLISQVLKSRSVQRTLEIVDKVIKKYERYDEYRTASRVEELPRELQMMMATSDAGTENVTTLAADVRALKQLFHLRQEQREVEKQVAILRKQAKETGLLQTTMRTGRNQQSLLGRREIRWQYDAQLPPAYVYSRIRCLKTLSGHLQIQAYCLAYDKSGKVVITGSDDRLVKVWSLRTGDLLFTLRGHVGNITDLAVNHDNTLLASSSDDKTVRVWEISSGAPVAVLVGHSGVVNAVRFHPTNNNIVTASDDGRCFCYKLPEIPLIKQPETKIETARRLYSLNAYMLSLHPIYAMKHARREGVRSCKVHCVTFSRCGDFVASGGHDGTARIWDISMASAPDAPAVVPRFQPTNEPEEESVQEREVPGTAIPVALPQALPELGSTLPVTSHTNAVATAVTVDSFQAVGTLPQPPLLSQPSLLPPRSQVSLQSQIGADIPLPTVAEALRLETTPRQTQPPQVQNDLPSLSLSDDDVPSIEPIALLKGHKGPVSSIAYNNRGDQLVTASIKDSATRLWRWKRRYKSLFGAVLLANESLVEFEDTSSIYGIRGRKKPIPVVDMVAWTHDDKRLITLHSVKLGDESSDQIWEQRLRVWDPETGKSLLTLGAIDKDKRNGHVNAAFALSTHPSDWRIVVTAGYDGRVFLWDISTGRMLKSFTNLSPDLKPLSILDGGFTPDGSGFCFTDHIGRLLIFGTGSGEQYAATPVQQYFLHDYVMLITDGHYNVRDRETQELPSLMDPGPLMDASLVQYPHQPPHLLLNKVWTPKEYAENRRLRIQQSIESEIRCGVRHVPEVEEDIHSFPLAIIKNEKVALEQGGFAADTVAVARASYRLNGAPVTLSELRRRGSEFRRNTDPQRRRREAEERDTSVLELEISSDDDRSDEDFQVPTPRHAAEEEEEDEDEDEEELDSDDNLSGNENSVISPAHSRRRRLRSARQRVSPRVRLRNRGGRRLRSDSEELEHEDVPRQLRTRQSAARTRSRLVLNSESEEGGGENPSDHMSNTDNERDAGSHDDHGDVVVESNDGVIMGDNQLDRFDQSMTYEQMLEVKQAHLGTAPIPAENTDEALIPCALCGVGDDDAMLKLPGDCMGVHPLIYGVQRVFVHDQCAIASPLCFNRDGNWFNVTKEIRRGRALTCFACSKRGATIGCTVSACRNSYHWKCAINYGWSVDQLHFFCPDHQSRRTQRHEHVEADEVLAEDGGCISEPVSKRFGLKFHREWLQLVNLRSVHQYVPQVGDYVVYLPEGHPGYLNYGGMPTPRYYARLSKFYAVKCHVADVKYVFPTAEEHPRCDTIKCELSLAVLAVPTSAIRFAREDQEHDEETKEDTGLESINLFDLESSPFAQFTSVDEQLSPTVSEPSGRFHFKLLYHSNDVANFLVLDHVYESGVCGDWHIGDRVQMPFVQLNEHGLEVEAKLSFGTVENIVQKPFTTSDYDEVSPWECVMVNWDDPDDDTCAVCPWELEAASVDERLEKRMLSLRRRSTRLYFSRSIIGEKCKSLLQEMDQVLTLTIARDFIYPVDEEVFIDYPISIANPIDLTRIQQRLRHGYYRQVEAFLADIRLLSINCEAYNISSSPISHNSRNLVAAILTQAQRHFPHLLRDTNRREADTERANVRYSYPPDDFLTNFGEDPTETQLALLEIELLNRTGEDFSENNHSALPVVSAVDPSPAVAQPATSTVDEVPPQRTLRSRTRSREEKEATEEKLDCDVEQGGVRLKSVPQARSTTTDEVDSANAQVFSPLQLRSREVITPQVVSPRTRRSPRVVRTTVSNGGSAARKRQRRNPDQELLTYSALMEKYSSADCEIIERACKEDLQAVLQVFHEALMEADKMDIFTSPVTDDIAPRYSEIIHHPMDFGTIQDRLYKYRSFRDYFAHVQLVFSNAITYNKWESAIGGVVEDLQKYCVKFLLDAAGVHLQKHKNYATNKAVRSTSGVLKTGAASGKQRALSKPVAVSEDEEDSWHSNSSEGEEDDDDDDDDDDDGDDDDDDDVSNDSDYGASRKRRLRRPALRVQKKKTRCR